MYGSYKIFASVAVGIFTKGHVGGKCCTKDVMMVVINAIEICNIMTICSFLMFTWFFCFMWVFMSTMR